MNTSDPHARIAASIDWQPTCLPGDEQRTIVRQVLDVAATLHPASAAPETSDPDADRLARALHDADCGCGTYDESEDPRYITAARAALAAAATPADEPAVWWSPTERKVFGRIPMRMEEVYTRELPADAVRLVPEFAGTALTPSTRLGWLGIVQSYLEENGVDAEPLLVHLGVSGELAAGAVPDTGQARESALSRYFAPDDPAEEPILPAAVAFRAGWDRAIAATSSPSGDTVQAPTGAKLRELAAALAADPSLDWDHLVNRAFQIRVGASRQAPDVTALLTFVRQVAEIPAVACSFAMCDGPDVEPVPMKTCHTCWAVHDARALLGTDTQRDPEEARRG